MDCNDTIIESSDFWADAWIKARRGSVLATTQEQTPLKWNVQMLFQDPEGALNPMKSIERQFFDVCRLTGSRQREEAVERTRRVLEQVGLSDEILCRLPNQLSGGQNQRVALGKLLLLNPAVIILDEPTSALDISVQASILHLLKDIQHRHSLTYVFISHDMEVIRFMCDEVISMDHL